MPDKSSMQRARKNPALMAVISPPPKPQKAEVNPDAVSLISEMLDDQSAILQQYKRLGAPTAYATGARDALLFALKVITPNQTEEKKR